MYKYAYIRVMRLMSLLAIIIWITMMTSVVCQAQEKRRTEDYSKAIQQRVEILSAIGDGRLNEDDVIEEVIREVVWFERMAHNKTYTKSYFFDSTTVNMARSFLDTLELSKDEELICRFYAGEISRIGKRLRSSEYKGTRIQEEYKARGTHFRRKLDFFGGFTGGVWIPVGNRNALGIHPTAGFALGADWPRYTFSIGIYVSWGHASDPYVVVKDGVARTTDEFTLAKPEIQFGRRLWYDNRHEFQVLVSSGGQWLRAIGKTDDYEGQTIFSFFAAIGFAYRYFLGEFDESFIQVEPAIDFSKLDTDGGTDLSGAAITMKFSWRWGGV